MDLRKIIKETLEKELNENVIVPPSIPNTINFWHGGNLDDYNDIIAQKTGRYEYGPGLYVTTHHGTALKYSKGSRKLYLLSIAAGQDISTALIPEEKVKQFINTYIISSKRKEIWNRLQKFINNGQVKAYNFNVIILNEKAIKPSNTKFLRSFYVDNGIDYEIVENAFGWGEKMMVLYNMKKIVNTIIVGPKDNILNYDL